MKAISNTSRKVAAAAVPLPRLPALSAQAAIFTLNPSADAFVTTRPSGNLSGDNYGGAGALSVAGPGLAATGAVLLFGAKCRRRSHG